MRIGPTGGSLSDHQRPRLAAWFALSGGFHRFLAEHITDCLHFCDWHGDFHWTKGASRNLEWGSDNMVGLCEAGEAPVRAYGAQEETFAGSRIGITPYWQSMGRGECRSQSCRSSTAWWPCIPSQVPGRTALQSPSAWHWTKVRGSVRQIETDSWNINGWVGDSRARKLPQTAAGYGSTAAGVGEACQTCFAYSSATRLSCSISSQHWCHLTSRWRHTRFKTFESWTRCPRWAWRSKNWRVWARSNKWPWGWTERTSCQQQWWLDRGAMASMARLAQRSQLWLGWQWMVARRWDSMGSVWLGFGTTTAWRDSGLVVASSQWFASECKTCNPECNQQSPWPGIHGTCNARSRGGTVSCRIQQTSPGPQSPTTVVLGRTRFAMGDPARSRWGWRGRVFNHVGRRHSAARGVCSCNNRTYRPHCMVDLVARWSGTGLGMAWRWLLCSRCCRRLLGMVWDEDLVRHARCRSLWPTTSGSFCHFPWPFSNF